jgi:hypothetical protein
LYFSLFKLEELSRRYLHSTEEEPYWTVDGSLGLQSREEIQEIEHLSYSSKINAVLWNE